MRGFCLCFEDVRRSISARSRSRCDPEAASDVAGCHHADVQISILMVQGLAFDFILVSRRSARRAGTRYLTRGVDEHGSVANYVETEQILGMNGHWTAFVQTRGSIPLFWGQTSSALKYNPAAVITHSRLETVRTIR